MFPKVLAVYLSKGGVGKTTLTGLLGQYLAGLGQRVAIIDLDRQGSQSELFGVEKAEALHRVIRRETHPRTALTPINPDLLPAFEGHDKGALFLIQGGPLTALAINQVIESPVDFGIVSNVELFTGLIAGLGDAEGPDGRPYPSFDWVLIDMGPSDQKVAMAALVETDYVLIPTDCEWLSLQRIEPVLKELALARRVKEDVELIGIVPVKAEYHFGRLRQSKTLAATLAWLEQNFSNWLLRDRRGIVDIPFDEEWKNAIWIGELLFGSDTKRQVQEDALRFLAAVGAKLGLPEVKYVRQ